MNVISTARINIGGTGATGSALAPGNAHSAIVSAQVGDALIRFDGGAPTTGATGAGHMIHSADAPVVYPVGTAARIVGVSNLGATGCYVDVTWLE